ncbi:MAG TPA: ROK family protein [Acidobacteriota bacterium]|nr:ROK family protein [Acidobacteriota bacterium]
MRKIDLNNLQAASSETARDINRRIVLNLIRSRQPLSRADLARSSGLQRSTVSAIVDQLIKEGWVVEGPLGRLPRGRRPIYLKLNARRAIIGIDIRPSRTIIATADINAHFDYQEIQSTPSDSRKAVRQLTSRLQHLLRSRPGMSFEGIGISLPGRIDSKTNKLCFAPNLHWRSVDIKTPLARATGLEVELENAANACALAETWFGPNDNTRDLVVVTVSEGIGIGLFMNGQLVRGPDGMAGEFGHSTLEVDGPLCGCGNRGCWEMLASNRAALRHYSQSAEASEVPTYLELLALADQGDVQAAKALDTQALYLGRGLRTLAAGLAPAAIVIVGEIALAWDRVGPKIEGEIASYPLPGKPPRIQPAHDGETARLRGTVALVLQKHFAASSFL